MHLDVSNLARFSEAPAPAREPAPPRPPRAADLLVIGAGNSGEGGALRLAALSWGDGLSLPICGINNDGLAPRPIPIRRPGGHLQPVELEERLLLGGGNPRDQLRDYPLLARRYARLLRGIPVLESYPRAGYGGHGFPAVSSLDIDLEIEALLAFLQRNLRRLRDEEQPGQSDWQRLMAARRRSEAARRRRLRVVVIGGVGGSMGNAAHHLLPYLLRHLLRESGVSDYELWGVALGPQAFSGLTPFIRHNARALLLALDHLSRHGQRRAYINGLEIDMQAPPYDRLFLLDDPAIAGEAGRVSEADLEAFLDRSAVALYLLLARGTVWPTIASHLANDDGAGADGRLRYLHTVRAAMADIDRAALRTALAARLEHAALDRLARRLAL